MASDEGDQTNPTQPPSAEHVSDSTNSSALPVSDP